jgi:glycosyltransferase involved in cell wall biosynthesis
LRVCVDAAVAASGVGTYAAGMAAALGELPGVEAIVAAPDGGAAGPAARVAWRERNLRGIVAGREADVLLAAAPELPLRRLPVPAAVVVHDVFPLSAPRLTGRGQRLRYRALLPRMLRRADAVVCVSAATRDELREHVPGVDAAVIGQGPSPFPTLPREPSDYLLYVGEDFPRKNLRTLLHAELGMELVLAGPPPPGKPLPRGHLGFVDERRLAELYAGAAALVLPSLAEGFGRPVLDAMARGVPVIASDIPALRELTGGDAALLVADPLDPAQWRAAVDALAARADELSERGRERAEAFAWPRVARQMADLLARIA